MACWLIKPPPIEIKTILPLIFSQDQDELIVLGGWSAIDGYQASGTNAVEIRCSRDRGICSEAIATIFHHAIGGGLDAHVFNYRIVRWDEAGLEAVAEDAMAGCLERRLAFFFDEKSSDFELFPPSGCQGDTGRAVWIGDSL